jgi:hypothetical protein
VCEYPFLLSALSGIAQDTLHETTDLQVNQQTKVVTPKKERYLTLTSRQKIGNRASIFDTQTVKRKATVGLNGYLGRYLHMMASTKRPHEEDVESVDRQRKQQKIDTLEDFYGSCLLQGAVDPEHKEALLKELQKPWAVWILKRSLRNLVPTSFTYRYLFPDNVQLNLYDVFWRVFYYFTVLANATLGTEAVNEFLGATVHKDMPVDGLSMDKQTALTTVFWTLFQNLVERARVETPPRKILSWEQLCNMYHQREGLSNFVRNKTGQTAEQRPSRTLTRTFTDPEEARKSKAIEDIQGQTHEQREWYLEWVHQHNNVARIVNDDERLPLLQVSRNPLPYNVDLYNVVEKAVQFWVQAYMVAFKIQYPLEPSVSTLREYWQQKLQLSPHLKIWLESPSLGTFQNNRLLACLFQGDPHLLSRTTGMWPRLYGNFLDFWRNQLTAHAICFLLPHFYLYYHSLSTSSSPDASFDWLQKQLLASEWLILANNSEPTWIREILSLHVANSPEEKQRFECLYRDAQAQVTWDTWQAQWTGFCAQWQNTLETIEATTDRTLKLQLSTIQTFPKSSQKSSLVKLLNWSAEVDLLLKRKRERGEQETLALKAIYEDPNNENKDVFHRVLDQLKAGLKDWPNKLEDPSYAEIEQTLLDMTSENGKAILDKYWRLDRGNLTDHQDSRIVKYVHRLLREVQGYHEKLQNISKKQEEQIKTSVPVRFCYWWLHGGKLQTVTAASNILARVTDVSFLDSFGLSNRSLLRSKYPMLQEADDLKRHLSGVGYKQTPDEVIEDLTEFSQKLQNFSWDRLSKARLDILDVVLKDLRTQLTVANDLSEQNRKPFKDGSNYMDALDNMDKTQFLKWWYEGIAGGSIVPHVPKISPKPQSQNPQRGPSGPTSQDRPPTSSSSPPPPSASHAGSAAGSSGPATGPATGPSEDQPSENQQDSHLPPCLSKKLILADIFNRIKDKATEYEKKPVLRNYGIKLMETLDGPCNFDSNGGQTAQGGRPARWGFRNDVIFTDKDKYKKCKHAMLALVHPDKDPEYRSGQTAEQGYAKQWTSELAKAFECRVTNGW